MKITATLIVLLLCAAMISGQTDAARPTPTPDTDVVRISTNLIQLDFTATDDKGRPVRDLRPSDLEVYENGKKQAVTGLSFIASTRQVDRGRQNADRAAPPSPPGVVRAENVRRTFALVVDDLSLSFESAYQTRRALKRFVDEQMQPGDLVAIVRTGAGMGALQQFTADKRLLYAGIEKVKWNPLGTGGISAFAPLDQEPSADGAGEVDSADAVPASGGDSLEDFRGRVFATGTLGALRYVVQGMGELPGRKSVILISQGFKLLEQSGDFLSTGTVLDFVKLLVDEATRSSVVFYAIDPRGLVSTGLTAADRVSPTSGAALAAATAGRSRELSDTQDGLKYLTRETGGFAVVNNNDLSSGVRRVLDDQSYYLVAYEPESETFDPKTRKFNRIEIKVLRPGVNVRNRSGFINVAEREPPAAPVIPATDRSLAIQMQTALVSPFVRGEIGLRLNGLFGTDSKNQPFVRSLLHVDAADLKFTDEPNGVKKTVFDVMAMSFGDNGQVVDQLFKTYTLTFKPNSYRGILANGFVYNFYFPVKTPGAYQYRVAFRDTQSGKIGSASQFIEVPNVKKNRLTLSSLLIESITPEDWQRSNAPGGPPANSDPMTDTAVRRLKANRVLRYGLEVYNAKLNAGQPRLTSRIRVFRDGLLVLDGAKNQVDATGQTDLTHLKLAGAIALGKTMIPGDYVLQIIVTDENTGKKPQTSSQFIQFEIVE